VPVTVDVPVVVGAKKVMLQRLSLLLAGTFASVHEALEKEPAVAVQETVPVGLVGLAPPVSEMVAVHVVEPPTTAEDGAQFTLVELPRVTENACAFDSPPPGAGLKTVIGNDPIAVRSLAGIAAVTCVELMKVVVRLEPLKRTTELEMKLVPFTVSVNAPLFCALLVGEMLVVVGTGFVTVKVTAVPVNEFPALSVAVA